MSAKDEALKMAIEALQNNQTYDWKGNPLTALDEANEKVINACKKALEQPAQEPVAWIKNWADGSKEIVPDNYEGSYPVYTRPAQPLSDDEIQKTWYNLYPLDENNLWTDMLEGEHLRKFARAIETLIKEKNSV